MTRPSVISIDGPGAVGKTTVGRLLAERLGYLFIDTGAMYRALTLLAMEQGLNWDDERALIRLAKQVKIGIKSKEGAPGGQQAVVVDGRDVTEDIRHPDVEKWVSLVAKIEEVRETLVLQQRGMAQEGEVVMVGRDIGTVVLPDADLKLYLIASAEERARRRHRELMDQGYREDYKAILKDLKRRDKIDSERAVAPLRPAEDARIVDTEGLTLEEVVDFLYCMIEG